MNKLLKKYLTFQLLILRLKVKLMPGAIGYYPLWEVYCWVVYGWHLYS